MEERKGTRGKAVARDLSGSTNGKKGLHLFRFFPL
jgi:hypothetical protein